MLRPSAGLPVKGASGTTHCDRDKSMDEFCATGQTSRLTYATARRCLIAALVRDDDIVLRAGPVVRCPGRVAGQDAHNNLSFHSVVVTFVQFLQSQALITGVFQSIDV